MIAGVAFIYVLLTLCAGFIQGTGGLNSTILTANMSATNTSCEVQNTAGFLSADKITVGGESMVYTSIDYTHFYGLTRSNPVAHLATNSDGSPTMVYNQQTSILNSALGYNTSAISTSAGGFAVFLIPLKFFTTTLPNLVRGGSLIPFLPTELQWLGYVWLAVTIGIVVSIGIAVIWVASNLIGRIV
jgi:hypothetical protein